MSIRDEAVLLWQKKKEEVKKQLVLEGLKEIFGNSVSMMVLENNNPLLDAPRTDAVYVYIQDGETPFLVEAVYNPFDKKIVYNLIARCSSCKEVFTCDDYNGVVQFDDLETLGRAIELIVESESMCNRCYQ